MHFGPNKIFQDDQKSGEGGDQILAFYLLWPNPKITSCPSFDKIQHLKSEYVLLYISNCVKVMRDTHIPHVYIGN